VSAIPIEVTIFVTWRSSMPTKAVELIVRPENPVDVSVTDLRKLLSTLALTTNAVIIEWPTEDIVCGVH
jgi:predicted nucleotidyltransferase